MLELSPILMEAVFSNTLLLWMDSVSRKYVVNQFELMSILYPDSGKRDFLGMRRWTKISTILCCWPSHVNAKCLSAQGERI